jgi:hypothetical protein
MIQIENYIAVIYQLTIQLDEKEKINQTPPKTEQTD